jgi:hypothetical protein
MENNMLKIQFIQKCIESSYRFTFENVSNFILRLVLNDYYSTRSVNDGKVDGLVFDSNVKRSFYSIYGPKKHDWKKTGKAKVDEDADGIKEFLKRHQVELKKWYFVINRELSGDEVEYIKMKFDDPIKVDIITPSKFIELIVKKDVVIETARFLNLLNYDVPLTDLQPYAFIKHVFLLLTKMKTWSKEEQLKEMDQIIDAIVDLAYLDIEDKPRINQKLRFMHMLQFYTRIPKKKLKSFAYIDGTFVELSELQEEVFSKSEHNYFVLTPNNLVLIYSIIKKLQFSLKQNNTYRIDSVLNDMYSGKLRYSAIRKQRTNG